MLIKQLDDICKTSARVGLMSISKIKNDLVNMKTLILIN